MGGKMLICDDIVGTFFKKYKCADCKVKLNRKKVSKIINTKSEEAKNYDFSQPGGDGYMIGNIKFVKTAFRCNKCDKTYSIEELLEIEKGVLKG